MKGLVVSLAVFAAYVLAVAVFAHAVKVERPSKLFFGMFAAWIPVYFLAYFLTPADLGFLPPAWLTEMPWLDAAFGFVVFALNFHNVLDFYFAVCGGFSTCLLLDMHRDVKGLTTEDVIAMFRGEGDMDKIYAWRVPRLAETGYLKIDNGTGMCKLTPKGVFAARVALAFKCLLNLEAGG